jgi:hypothetical protein
MTPHPFHPGHPITDVCNDPDCLQMRNADVHLTRGQLLARAVVRWLVMGLCLGGLFVVGVCAGGWCG